jgi:hypothetical protein
MCWLIGKEMDVLTAAQLGVAVVGVVLVLLALWRGKGVLTKVLGAGVVAAVAAWLVFSGIPWLQNQVATETNTVASSTSVLGTNIPKTCSTGPAPAPAQTPTPAAS